MSSSLMARPRWALMVLLLVAVFSVTSAQEGGQPDPLTLPPVPETTAEPSVPVEPEPTQELLPTAEPVTPTALPPDIIPLPDVTAPTVETGGEWSRSLVPSTSQTESGNAPRDPAGSLDSTTQGFDIVGAYPWHLAGYRGAGIKIALLDFGFGVSTTINPNRQPEYVCLASFPNVSMVAGFGAPVAGDTGRGLTTAEILCDLAPESDVSLYKITSAGRLYDAIVNASTTGHQVILINVDYGASFSPGDGTFGRGSTKDVYAALAAAKAAGSTIIVAAGNTGTSYKTFTYSGGASNIAITAQPGDTVDISWNDWDTQPNSGGAREDLTVSLVGDGFTALAKPARGGGLPAYQWTIPNCTQSGNNCQNLRLEFSSSIVGNAANLVVQVSVGGIGRFVGDPSGGGISDIAGSLTRPADSPDVITVGAVCSNRAGGFQRLTYSATGPVFGAGGNIPGLPLDPFPANAVKPEVVGPSQVNTFTNRINDIAACTEGFGGTQPAAAHVAGMAALLRQNDTNANITLVEVPQPNLLTYLRTHSIDLPLDFGNGYDFEHGAGLAVLGRSSYDNDPQLETLPAFPAPDRIPAGLCTGSDVNIDAGDILYVGPDTSGEAKNGTLTAPYN
ncbi:MAG: S8 family serine peptidase, partial [Anaerolineae bacterium]|nr:S8 family serine peptidase [Anaerolineae bacterium]